MNLFNRVYAWTAVSVRWLARPACSNRLLRKRAVHKREALWRQKIQTFQLSGPFSWTV